LLATEAEAAKDGVEQAEGIKWASVQVHFT
jgi:hypothetical protein